MPIIEIITQYINKKGLKQTDLGRKMGKSRQFVNGLLTKNKDLNSVHIKEISMALEYDFFAELSKELPKEIRQTTNKDGIVDTAIIDLIKEKYPNSFK